MLECDQIHSARILELGEWHLASGDAVTAISWLRRALTLALAETPRKCVRSSKQRENRRDFS